MTQLQGSTALVTGAYGGLGTAIVKALHREGAKVIVTGRKAAPLEKVAADTGARSVLADLADRDDLDRLLSEAGELDIAVMNAALPASGDIEEWTQEQIDRAIEVNLGNPIAMTRALLPAFRRRGSGHFVYISSLAGKVASKGGALYAATKFGLRGFSHGLYCDLMGTGVGCSVVNPGFIGDAGMFAETGAKLPFGVSTVSPEKVADGVIRVIRTNKAELDVAPIGLKLGAAFGSLIPGFSAKVQARIGGGLPEAVVEGQRNRRD
jgi:NAD(P)-dependent dehydrogenase (short-subunit alcohol dehydrogenase family)